MQGAKREGTGKAEGPPFKESLAGGHPGTPGAGKKSRNAYLRAGGWMVVGRGLSDVPLQCTKKGSKNEGGGNQA
jgi:hypothetical protein